MRTIIAFLKRFNPYSQLNTKFLKAFLALYPPLAAILYAFQKDYIVSSSLRSWQYIHHVSGTSEYTLNWVFFYWLVLILWGYGYFVFVINESASNAQTTANLRSAIFRSPNPNIFRLYEIHYRGIQDLISAINTLHDNETTKKEIHIRGILQSICELTSSFANNPNTKIIYGANIMLYIPLKAYEATVKKLRAEKQNWLHFHKDKLEAFNGILHLMPSLAYKAGNTIDISQTDLPAINLPVITNANPETALKSNIPGAPVAAINERFLFSDVRDESAYRHLGDIEVDNAKIYWSERVTNLRSVMCFGLPYDWTKKGYTDVAGIIGVLNIDSTNPNILGTDWEYHTTYFSLMYPILCQLTLALESYYSLIINEL